MPIGVLKHFHKISSCENGKNGSPNVRDTRESTWNRLSLRRERNSGQSVGNHPIPSQFIFDATM